MERGRGGMEREEGIVEEKREKESVKREGN